jgi:hypothetical protein
LEKGALPTLTGREQMLAAGANDCAIGAQLLRKLRPPVATPHVMHYQSLCIMHHCVKNKNGVKWLHRSPEARKAVEDVAGEIVTENGAT